MGLAYRRTVLNEGDVLRWMGKTDLGEPALARPREDSDRFIRLLRDQHRCQITCTSKALECERIAPVGLDPITGLARDLRWR
jgi:hypothetical protein